ncbi:MAG TPA: hypothetical protein VKU79_01525 [Thermoplasmataceae archaeon]|nr:hypothetical protein [Thermoplasmatales archaeon AK]HLH85529.1 hypothetical protein [Thermoplasmataceae archaeon]
MSSEKLIGIFLPKYLAVSVAWYFGRDYLADNISEDVSTILLTAIQLQRTRKTAKSSMEATKWRPNDIEILKLRHMLESHVGTNLEDYQREEGIFIKKSVYNTIVKFFDKKAVNPDMSVEIRFLVHYFFYSMVENFRLYGIDLF